MTKKDFIERMSGSIYNYEDVPNEFRTTDKVSIHCNLHGGFQQAVYAHLRGQGCPLCKGTRPYTTEEFIEIIKPFCKNVSFNKTVYTSGTNPVTITCNFHGDYEVIPRTLFTNKSGNGCSSCKANSCTGGYNYNYIERNPDNFTNPGYVYISTLKDVNGKIFYKVGVTINDPRGRTKYYKPHTLLNLESFLTTIGYAYYVEQEIINSNKINSYTPSIKIQGHTECLSINPSDNIKEILYELN